jgi:hypothetical protein
MYMELKNVGEIEKAVIEIKGMTVIAGKKDTGKSIPGSIMYCMLQSHYTGIDFTRELHKRLFELILKTRKKWSYKDIIKIDKTVRRIIKASVIRNRVEYTKEMLSLEKTIKKDFPKSDFLEIVKVAHMPLKELKQDILNKSIKIGFKGKDWMHEHGEVSAIINGTRVNWNVKENEVSAEVLGVVSVEGIRLHEFKDLDSIILDAGDNDKFSDNFDLDADGEDISYKSKVLLDRLSSICKDIMPVGTYKRYTLDDIESMSKGLRIFMVLKILVSTGKLKDNILYLDEIGSYLKPELQTVFAEILVLIHAHFNTLILVNTQSGQFLNDIEKYSKKHGVVDKCKYYLAERVTGSLCDGGNTTITDFTDDIEKIKEELIRL